ncbi:MAG TPA: thioredoxin family protein [Actinomycetota bacterium]
MTTEIRILGPGCIRCETLFEHTKRAVADLGMDAEVRKVEDLDEIVRRGILATPALVVDDRLLLAGHVPTASRIRELLSA